MSELTKQSKLSHSMRRGIAASAVSVVAIAAVGIGDTAPSHESASAKAHRLASEYTKDLYNPTFVKGVKVPAILNGSVEIAINTLSGTHVGGYKNPIILVPGHNGDTSAASIDGAWIGYPGSDAQGRVTIVAEQVHLGGRDDGVESITLNPGSVEFDSAAIYLTAVDGAPDALQAFDSTGEGLFPSVQVESFGMK